MILFLGEICSLKIFSLYRSISNFYTLFIFVSSCLSSLSCFHSSLVLSYSRAQCISIFFCFCFDRFFLVAKITIVYANQFVRATSNTQVCTPLHFESFLYYKEILFSTSLEYNRLVQLNWAYFPSAKKDPQEGYKTLTEQQTVYIHPSSALFNHNPDWLIYHEIVLTTKEYMRSVIQIEPQWLVEVNFQELSILSLLLFKKVCFSPSLCTACSQILSRLRSDEVE